MRGVKRAPTGPDHRARRKWEPLEVREFARPPKGVRFTLTLYEVTYYGSKWELETCMVLGEDPLDAYVNAIHHLKCIRRDWVFDHPLLAFTVVLLISVVFALGMGIIATLRASCGV